MEPGIELGGLEVIGAGCAGSGLGPYDRGMFPHLTAHSDFVTCPSLRVSTAGAISQASVFSVPHTLLKTNALEHFCAGRHGRRCPPYGPCGWLQASAQVSTGEGGSGRREDLRTRALEAGGSVLTPVVCLQPGLACGFPLLAAM